MQYGRSKYREDRIFDGGSRKERESFSWMFWLIEAPDRTILVDTGFDSKKKARELKFRDYVPPAERLRSIGIEASQVDDVILTHAHWDHVGDLARYTNAQVWMQKKEYEFLESRVSKKNPSRNGLRLEDLLVLKKVEEDGRLMLVDGSVELMAGISMTPGGSHTRGSQYVTVETLDGPVVIASDTTYFYENNQSHIPIGRCSDTGENLATIREMHRRAASPFYILPGHDPRVMRWFPEVAEGVVHITAVPD